MKNMNARDFYSRLFASAEGATPAAFVYKRVTAVIALLAAILMGVAQPSQAATEADIYRAQVPVTDQSEAERNRALKEGLAQVFVKVSGSKAMLGNPAVETALQRASRYVSEVGYRRGLLPGEPEPVLTLSVSYAQPQIDRLLRREQLQIWPATRPELLVWLVVDDIAAGKYFIDSEQFPEVIQALEFYMAKRSLPLRQPLLDLQERRTLTPAQTWAFDQNALEQAADRYGAEHWMVVRLYETSAKTWRGTSSLTIKGSTELQNYTDASIAGLIAQVVDYSANQVASRYAFVPQLRDEPVTLVLENVQSFDDYSQAKSFLGSLELVRSVDVEAVESDKLTLKLRVDGEVDLLMESLERDARFRQIAPGTLIPGSPHRFIWGAQ